MNRQVPVEIRDRITRLPDELLANILSFLSTKECVRTSLLSTKWKLVWASVPALHLSSEDFKPTYDKFKFSSFVNQFLLQNSPSCIEKIYLSGRGPFAIESCLKSVNDHVQDMELDLNLQYQGLLGNLHKLFERLYIEAPPSLFKCRKLVVLKLRLITLDIPKGSICYPCLKVLELVGVQFKKDTTVQNIISSCPVLEDLTIVTHKLGDRRLMPKVSVASQTLKRLKLHFQGSDFDKDGTARIMIVIDTPALRFLDILDEHASEFVVGEMRFVSEAKIDMRARFKDKSLYGKYLFKFLSAINNAKYLLLSDVTMVSLMQANSYEFPTFNNLTHLEVKYFDQTNPISLEFLTEFINSSPKMERLIYDSYEIHAKEADWIYHIRMCPNFFRIIYGD